MPDTLMSLYVSDDLVLWFVIYLFLMGSSHTIGVVRIDLELKFVGMLVVEFCCLATAFVCVPFDWLCVWRISADV
jgi:hypothetical protein